jgi:hypothetical protein
LSAVSSHNWDFILLNGNPLITCIHRPSFFDITYDVKDLSNGALKSSSKGFK